MYNSVITIKLYVSHKIHIHLQPCCTNLIYNV